MLALQPTGLVEHVRGFSFPLVVGGFEYIEGVFIVTFKAGTGARIHQAVVAGRAPATAIAATLTVGGVAFMSGEHAIGSRPPTPAPVVPILGWMLLVGACVAIVGTVSLLALVHLLDADDWQRCQDINVTGTISTGIPASTLSSRFWQESSP